MFLVCVSICFNLDSARLSLVTCEFLGFSGVNFEISGGIPWMSVSLLLGLVTYGNQTNIVITLVLNEISSWKFLETILSCWHNSSKWFQIFVCQYVFCLSSLLKFANIVTCSVLNELSFWYFLETFLRHFYTSSIPSKFLFVCQSVWWLVSLLILG